MKVFFLTSHFFKFKFLRFHTHHLFRDQDCCIICYDVTDQHSWIQGKDITSEKTQKKEKNQTQKIKQPRIIERNQRASISRSNASNSFFNLDLFLIVKRWMSDCDRYAQYAPKIIVGCKNDLERKG